MKNFNQFVSITPGFSLTIQPQFTVQTWLHILNLHAVHFASHEIADIGFGHSGFITVQITFNTEHKHLMNCTSCYLNSDVM